MLSYICILLTYWAISLISRMFSNGLGDCGSSRVKPKTQKMVLDFCLA